MNTDIEIVEMKAIGRRKRAVATVTLTPTKMGGESKIVSININGRDILDYMQSNITLVSTIQDPLDALGFECKYDAEIKVQGGGLVGQAQAIRLAISRALILLDSDRILKAKGFLTQDSRCKERKKYSLKKARRAPQFSKR
jgi:small subunit ribosomal protein S9